MLISLQNAVWHKVSDSPKETRFSFYGQTWVFIVFVISLFGFLQI